MDTHYWYNESGDTLIFSFNNPLYVPPPPPDPVERLEATAGNWNGSFDYLYETTSNGKYLYGLVDKGSTNRYSGYDVEYDPSDGKFYDEGPNHPAQWSHDDTGTNLSDFPTDLNMQTQYWYNSNGSLIFQFNNPYYVAPEAGYKYLAFYGRSGTSNGWFYELELTTTDGLIDYTNPVALNKITVVGTPLGSEYNNPSCIFDGQTTQPGSETLIFDANEIGVYFTWKTQTE
jgi:hypothetical protein